ncbi:hypothetical protein EJB05_04590, partial [Eragrostis curvula]
MATADALHGGLSRRDLKESNHSGRARCESRLQVLLCCTLLVPMVACHGGHAVREPPGMLSFGWSSDMRPRQTLHTAAARFVLPLRRSRILFGNVLPGAHVQESRARLL